MTDVRIGNKSVRLTNPMVIGVGGEATVFEYKGQAVKIYHDATQQRSNKLYALMPLARKLPPSVVAPQELVTNGKGRQAVGFTMTLLDATHTEIRQLAVKKYRAQAGLTSRDVVQLFLNIHRTLTQIHAAGMVVGDLNDLNLMFQGQQASFIDADSFQFGQYPCIVGTESFIDPQLYGKDLAAQSYYTPDNDWYAFAVLLFKSLLLVHPYGGIHPSVHTLTARAKSCLTVFEPDVTYPRIAYNRELLSDELTNAFKRVFAHGERGIFPESVLTDYLNALTTCPHCAATYPSNRAHCPMCAAAVPITVPAQVQFETLIHAQGPIITWHISGDTVRALAHENGKVVLYTVDQYRQPERKPLFNVMPTASYAFLGDVLVVCPAQDSTDLLIVDISGNSPQPITQTVTARFGNTETVFGTSARSLYRIAGGYLMRGHIAYGQLIEHPVMAITEQQTWFTVAPHTEQVFGYFRVFNDYQYWLLVGSDRYEADLTPLQTDEVLLDAHAYFGSKTVLVLRHTQLNGVESVRIDEIDHKGRRLNAHTAPQAADLLPLAAHAYSHNMLLQASDQGIVQTRQDTQTHKTFSQTEPITRKGDAITAYQKGLLIAQDQRLAAITL